MDDVQFAEALLRRLDVLIHFALKRELSTNSLTTREGINILNQLGLSDKEICRILGRSRSYVSSELTQIRKRREKNEERKERRGSRARAN